jgi:hypothetical protein
LALNASKNSRVCVDFMELAQEVEIITSVSLQGKMPFTRNPLCQFHQKLTNQKMNSHNHMNVIMAPHQYQTIIFTL